MYHGVEVTRMNKVASAVAVIFFAFACGSPQSHLDAPAVDGPPAPGGTVVVGLLSDIQSWNPYLVRRLGNRQVCSPSSTRRSPSSSPTITSTPPPSHPPLPRVWSWSENHLELTLELDPDAALVRRRPHHLTRRGLHLASSDLARTRLALRLRQGRTSIQSRRSTTIGSGSPTTASTPINSWISTTASIVPAHAWETIPFDEWAIDRLEPTRRRRRPVQTRQPHPTARDRPGAQSRLLPQRPALPRPTGLPHRSLGPGAHHPAPRGRARLRPVDPAVGCPESPQPQRSRAGGVR